MKNIPVFTTENGVATLILKEIPEQQMAYVMIRDSLEPEKLLGECRDFCVACGAERVFATGHEILERYPFYTAMWRMQCDRAALPDTDAALWPVQEKTLERWREIYNEKVRRVPNGAWMSILDSKEMLKKGDGYFIHRGEELLGIGRASGEMLDWVAAVKPGAGRDVVLALNHALAGDLAVLTVASVNEKAVKLYENLGFLRNQELSVWYQIK